MAVALLRLLAEQVIQPQVRPDAPQAFHGGMRLMKVDTFVVEAPDTLANERAFGRPGSGRSAEAFPRARVLSLCEPGTHVLWKSLIKPHRCGAVREAARKTLRSTAIHPIAEVGKEPAAGANKKGVVWGCLLHKPPSRSK